MPFGLPQQYPNTTGPMVSFGHIELKLAGVPFVGFKKIDYSRTRSREFPRGAHPDPLGKTLGENEYKASCELYFAEYCTFLDRLAALGLVSGYGNIFFDVTVTYNANGFKVVTDVIKGCTLDSTEASNSHGPSAVTRSFELNPVKILFDGKDDIGMSLPVISIFAQAA